MKRLNQIVALSLTSALVLAACGQSEEKPSATPSAGTGTAAPAETKEKLSLNFMIMSPANKNLPSDKSKDIILAKIQEKFNVELKVDYISNLNDFQTKLNLRLSSGDLPDMFQAGGAESNKYIIDKITADLTKYVTPQTMTNYYKYWINETDMKRYQVQDVFMRAPIPFNREQFISHYVRKDWIDALNKKDPSLNLKVPTNYDEFLAVAKAFTFNDPDGNGKNDTYGITAAAGGAGIPKDFPVWLKHNLNPGFYVDDKNQFIDSGSDIRLSAVLDDIRKLLDLKIVDPDWYLQKSPAHLDKVQQGKVGIFYSTGREAAFENAPNSVQKKTKDVTGVAAEFVPFNIAPNNYLSYQALPSTPFMISSKSDEKKVKRTIEILDWLAGEEGFLLTHYGLEGTHYKRDGKKVIVDTDAYKKDFTDNQGYNEIYAAIFGNIAIAPTPLGLELVNSTETDRDRKIVEQLRGYKYALLGTNVAPVQGYDLAAFRKQLYVYQAQVLLEEKDSSNWPRYRTELMGPKYHGKELFEGYAEQIAAALKQEVKFKSAN
jgi:ABC-type glycerol-3-phosphate transport system substrate-binding protein